MPAEADVSAVAEAIVKVVEAPSGKRPFRVHIDPTEDGAQTEPKWSTVYSIGFARKCSGAWESRIC